jgi:membrane protein required for colicin V production
MAKIDLILLIPILLGAFNGYKKGLLMEIVGISSFVIAIVLGFKFLSIGASLLEGFLGASTIKSISPYLSFIVIFFPAIFIIRKLGMLMRKTLRLTFLGTLDGVLGALLGGLTGLFGISILLWVVLKTGISLPQEWLKEAQLFDFVKDFAPNTISKISEFIPGGNWVEYLVTLKEKIETGTK